MLVPIIAYTKLKKKYVSCPIIGTMKLYCSRLFERHLKDRTNGWFSATNLFLYLVSQLFKTIQNLKVKDQSNVKFCSYILTIHDGMLNSEVLSASFVCSGCSPIFSERCLTSAWVRPSTFTHHL